MIMFNCNNNNKNNSNVNSFLFIISVILLILVNYSEGLLRRCYQCRSRGELGSCKDPFKFNATQVEDEPGVLAIPCASGWCGKLIEGVGTFREDDYDQAIQRMCVQRGPSDSEDRCAFTVYNYKKVYMCFCQGDLCNGSSNLISSKLSVKSIIMYTISIVIILFFT